MSKKIGRNDPCPCGSGKKFKKCHGSGSEYSSQKAARDKLVMDRMEAMIKQREAQQGLGRPFITADYKGEKFVAVGELLLHSPKWRTVHDFLKDYIIYSFR